MWTGEVDFGKQHKTMVLSWDLDPVDDVSCHIALFKVPTALTVMKSKEDLILMAANIAMSWDKEHRVQAKKQLSSHDVDWGGIPSHEWRVQGNAREKLLYARIIVCLKSGQTFGPNLQHDVYRQNGKCSRRRRSQILLLLLADHGIEGSGAGRCEQETLGVANKSSTSPGQRRYTGQRDSIGYLRMTY